MRRSAEAAEKVDVTSTEVRVKSERLMREVYPDDDISLDGLD